MQRSYGCKELCVLKRYTHIPVSATPMYLNTDTHTHFAQLPSTNKHKA